MIYASVPFSFCKRKDLNKEDKMVRFKNITVNCRLTTSPLLKCSSQPAMIVSQSNFISLGPVHKSCLVTLNIMWIHHSRVLVLRTPLKCSMTIDELSRIRGNVWQHIVWHNFINQMCLYRCRGRYCSFHSICNCVYRGQSSSRNPALLCLVHMVLVNAEVVHCALWLPSIFISSYFHGVSITGWM